MSESVNIIRKGTVYSFYFTVPWKNPIVSNNRLQAHLNSVLRGEGRVKDVSILGSIRVDIVPLVDGLKVEAWITSLTSILSDYLWGETEFIKVKIAEPFFQPVFETAKTMRDSFFILGLLGLAVVVVFKRV